MILPPFFVTLHIQTGCLRLPNIRVLLRKNKIDSPGYFTAKLESMKPYNTINVIRFKWVTYCLWTINIDSWEYLSSYLDVDYFIRKSRHSIFFWSLVLIKHYKLILNCSSSHSIYETNHQSHHNQDFSVPFSQLSVKWNGEAERFFLPSGNLSYICLYMENNG